MYTPLRHGCVPFLVLVLAGAAHAQTLFLAELDGTQVTPAVPARSPGSGSGQVILDPFTSTVSIELSVSGLVAPITAAHIHTGSVAAAGGVTIPLVGTGPTWTQTAGPLSAADLANLLGNRWYFNVHSTTFPAGEIRGQITPARVRFDANLTGAKVVPPTGSPATGLAEFTLLGTKQIEYSVTATGLVGTSSGAAIHEGAPGSLGPGLFPLVMTGATTFSGTTVALTDLEIAKLRSGLYYVNVHSTSFLNGEIRGQLTPSFTDYGTGCTGTPGIPVLDGSGIPVPGAAFTLDVTGGLASGGGVLLFTVGAAETSFVGCTLLVNTVPVVVSAPLLLDAAGNASLALTLSAATPTAWIQLQYAGPPKKPRISLSVSRSGLPSSPRSPASTSAVIMSSRGLRRRSSSASPK